MVQVSPLKLTHFSISPGHTEYVTRKGATSNTPLISLAYLRIFIAAKDIEVLPRPGSRNKPEQGLASKKLSPVLW
jgi:hypothetical protein